MPSYSDSFTGGAGGVATSTGSNGQPVTTTPGGVTANGPLAGTRLRAGAFTLAAIKALTDVQHRDVFNCSDVCIPVTQALTGALAGATSTVLQTSGNGTGGYIIYLDPAQMPATMKAGFYILDTAFVAQA